MKLKTLVKQKNLNVLYKSPSFLEYPIVWEGDGEYMVKDEKLVKGGPYVDVTISSKPLLTFLYKLSNSKFTTSNCRYEGKKPLYILTGSNNSAEVTNFEVVGEFDFDTWDEKRRKIKNKAREDQIIKELKLEKKISDLIATAKTDADFRKIAKLQMEAKGGGFLWNNWGFPFWLDPSFSSKVELPKLRDELQKLYPDYTVINM